ncbi:calcium-transporting ATPase [Xylaria bambusicola]|uniref:calcium-transporting ATPase n=1 Tax=Xylaria bambusicola TaxID=326684 RepID=UPI00200829F5|nr:calcium-transporting ATPase [Xylaria bambusicola]KAI0503047.1 calcium-transporting ATPase [Xylaria bambusicola]
MPWPWRDRETEGETLLPLSVPAINGVDRDYDFTSNGAIDRSRSPSRPGHVRTTSTQSRSVADGYAAMTPAETATRLRTSLTHGLAPGEALSRLRDFGPNEIIHDEPDPLWLRFLMQFREPLILLLLVSAFLSIFVGNMDDAVSITVAVTIVVTVGFVQEYRSEKSIEALNHLIPNHAHLVRAQSSKVPPNARSSTWPPVGDGQDSGDDTETPGEEQMEATSSKVMAAQLVPGDLVLFTTGDRIPADIRITKAVDLTIDESNLTGENEPSKMTADTRSRHTYSPSIPDSNELRHPSPSVLSPLYQSESKKDARNQGVNNIAYMGTLVRSGHGQGIVFATGGETHFGTIAASVSGTESPRSPLQLNMDQLGKQLSQISFGIIALISLVGLLQGKKLLDLFTISISLAVAAIPEGLPIIVTVTLALGVHRMAKHNAIVRKMPSVETLGSVNVVCSDKTGTLTMNHMTTTQMWYFGSRGPLDVDSDDVATETTPDVAALQILRIGNIANNARLAHSTQSILPDTQRKDFTSYTRWVGQPTDIAILDLLDRYKEHDVRESIGPRTAEMPFSSERKWMGVIIGAQPGNSEKEYAYMKGAIDKVLDACDSYLTPDGREVVMDSQRRQEAIQAAETMAEKGLRVLAFASGPINRSTRSRGGPGPVSRSSTPVVRDGNQNPSPSHDEELYRGLVFAGLVGMSDPPRPGVARSIRKLMRGGVKVIMITGDSPTTARAIGKQLGMHIATSREQTTNQTAIKPVITGDEVDNMTDDELGAAMQATTIFARTNPDHKLKIIRALQARGDIVAMTGDGVNDAPALKRADIGISMGMHGTDVAKEASDMILTDDDFSTILHAIEEGKGIFNNIQNFITFQLSTSVASLTLVLLCTCLGFKTPLNAMQILWINIIMDGPPAQSLGVEKVDPDVMSRPPRSRSEPVLTRSLITRVLTSAAIIMTGTMLVYYHEMLADGEVTRRDTTMTFTCFVLFDMFNALSCRSESKSIFRGEVGMFSNKLFNWAVALSLAGQLLVIYFPWLQEVFQTEALSLIDLVRLVALASSVFWADEARKWYRYGRKRLGGGYSLAV